MPDGVSGPFDRVPDDEIRRRWRPRAAVSLILTVTSSPPDNLT